VPSAQATQPAAGSGPLQKRQNQGISLAEVIGGLVEKTLKEKAFCQPCQPARVVVRRARHGAVTVPSVDEGTARQCDK
jgi:hypothetical protein